MSDDYDLHTMTYVDEHGPVDCSACPNGGGVCCREMPIVIIESSELHSRMKVGPVDPGFNNYELLRRGDGACIHLTAENRCEIYDVRPMKCRSFDCRTDDRFVKLGVLGASPNHIE